MNIYRILPLIFSVLFSQVAMASHPLLGTEGGNGGDDIGIEFRGLGKIILEDIRTNHPEFELFLKDKDLSALLDQALIIVVDTPLKVMIHGQFQDSVAVNKTNPLVVLVNRSRWQLLRGLDPRIKMGVVFHEILGLAEVETTGNYLLSARYVEKFGLSAKLIAPTPDNERTYMSCLEVDNALYLVNLNPTGLLKGTVRGFNAGVISQLQTAAVQLGDVDANKVVGLTFQVQTNYISTIGPAENCRFSQYNRFVFDCELASKFGRGNGPIPEEVELQYNDGTKKKIQGRLFSSRQQNILEERVLGAQEQLVLNLSLERNSSAGGNWTTDKIQIKFGGGSCN